MIVDELIDLLRTMPSDLYVEMYVNGEYKVGVMSVGVSSDGQSVELSD